MNASGDMLASVYDAGGMKTDIFRYADSLFADCVKLSGGQLTGGLKAAESSLGDGYIRNISIGEVLPENALNGDICVLVRDENAKKLGECFPGSIMLIEEAGQEVEYILVAVNYHGNNTVTLVRKNLAPYKHYFDTKAREEYAASEIDILLETIYSNFFPERIRKNLLTVELDGAMRRRCFLLSYYEMNNIDYFATAESRIALRDNLVSQEPYITRSITGNRTVYTVKDTGAFSTASQTASVYYRPAIVLPSDLTVINTTHKSLPAIKLPAQKYGIYVYLEGTWKECM